MPDIPDWILKIITAPWLWITLVFHFAILGGVAYLILLERKVASWVQDRIGPNRVGLGFGIIPWLKDKKMMGLGQPLADGMKFILKEDYRPKGVDAILFTIAPAVMITVVIISIAVLPWGGTKQNTKDVIVGGGREPATVDQITDGVRKELPLGAEVVAVSNTTQTGIARGGEVVPAPAGVQPQNYQVATVTYQWPFQIANLNIGVLFILAVLSLAVYGVVVGGYASNNKYSFLGGLRATANMISYEIPLGLAVLAVVVVFGTLDLAEIVNKQAHYWLGVIPAWNVFAQPLGFVLFLVCIHAEANRAPFDMAEAEQELVGGYHTEYSSMRFALFFLAEYAGMITTSAVCVALFFGGWHLPFLGGTVEPGNPSVTDSILLAIVRSFVFFGKTIGIIFIFMWVRWSLPRFRFDQLMMIAWRGLIPISLAQLLVTAVVIYYFPIQNDGIINGRTAGVLLLANGALIVGTMAVSMLLPAPPPTNRRLGVPNSRFNPAPAFAAKPGGI